MAGVPASEASPEAYADHWFGELQKFAPDITTDSQAKNEILGPAIGFVDGIGRTYAGSKSGAFGATSPIGFSLVTATDGRTTVAIILVVWDPEASAHDTWQQYFVRRSGRAQPQDLPVGVVSPAHRSRLASRLSALPPSPSE